MTVTAMNQRTSQRDPRVHVITHIHTDASNAESSELDDRLGGWIRGFDGDDTQMTWSECFTPIAALEAVLQRGHGDNGPVDMIIVTDHMRRASHSYPDGHLAAAARDHRLVLGTELATRTRDIDGKYRLGPEILAYGGPQLVDGPHGPYYGMSQDLLDELFATCMDDEGLELCTRRAGRLLQQRGVVHGLSHPFDGHDLSLEGTLTIICEFPFIETINGGYPAQSAQMLDALIKLNNAVLAGARLTDDALSPLGQRVVARIRQRGRWMFPLGGSDAHAKGYDRVITAVATPPGHRPEDVTPGELLGRMQSLADRRPCRQPSGCRPPVDPLEACGQATTPKALLSDVVSVVLQNIRLNLSFCKSPLKWARILPAIYTITADELRKRSRIQRQRMAALDTEFNPIALLAAIEAPSRIAQPVVDLAAHAALSPMVPPLPWPALSSHLSALGLDGGLPGPQHAAVAARCSVRR